MAIAMKLNGANNYNVLPFYSSKEYWHSKRWYTYGQICPVAARKDYLVPFQLYFTRDVVSTSGNITLDIKRVNDDFTVKSFTLNHSFIHTPEYVIIKFPEQQITALPLGLYYYKVTYQETNDSGIAQGEALEAYSDIISIMDDESDFVRLEYWNASDITTNGYSISFTDNFKFVSYIHSTIAKPDYEFEEELTKRLGYKFIETQVSTKVYKFNFLATEANCDAMRIARMCDYIKFTTSLDVYNALYMSFEVAWQDYGDVANLTVEFETDTIIQRLESFKRSDVANFYNALLYNINEPILFDYDTIAQYYSDFSGQGKMIRELDQITVDDITPASTMPIDLGQGAAKKIAIEEIFSKYSAFNEYFGFDEVNNAVYVKGNRSFYTMPLGDIIAGGYDESPGSVVKVERLTDIGDVRPDSLNANDLLKYDGTNWVTIPLASISSKIDKLTDINDVTPINLTADDLLKYDGSKWVNIPMASISGKVEGITVNNSNYYPEPTTKLITLPDLAIPIKNMADASAAELTVGSKIAFMTSAGQDRRATLESIFNLYSQLHGFFELDTVNNAIKVKEGRTLYTDGEIIAGGYGEGSGGTAIERLTDIGDVVPTNLATGDLLKYDGTNWVNIPITSISGKVEGITLNSNNYYPEPTTKLITLPNYPTTLPASDVYFWAKQPNKPSYSFSELSSHPTTLGGYGITDAVTIDTYQEIYGIKEFATTVYISTAYDTMLALKSLDDENFAIIDVRNKTGNSLSKFGYYGDRWAIDSNTILHTGNYAGELDNRYVNKAGDTMTGYLFFNANSGIDLVSIPGYKSAISINNAGADRIGINFTDGDGNLRIAKTDINRDWVSGDVNILLGSNNYKVWHAGNKRDMFSSMNEAFTTWGNEQVINVEGDANTYYPVVITIDGTKTWNSRISIHKNLGSRTPSYPGNHGNGTSSMWAMYEGRYSGWDGNSGYIVTKYVRQPYANLISKAELAGNSVGALVVYLRGGGCGYTVCTDYRGGINVYYERTEISGDSNYPVYVEPTTSVGNQGVLNTTGYDYIVDKAVRLETPRYIFSKPFDGTNNVTGGAKFNAICIETDNNGNDSGRISEINNYGSELHLQYNTSRGITMCLGGGNVGIGTTSPSNKLHVNGDTYCSGKITSGNWIRSDLYSAGIDHYADDSYSAAYNACAPNNDNYCCYSIVRSGTIPLGIGFNTSSEIWLGTANTDRKAAAQWLRISGNRVTCSSDIFAYGEVAAGSASDLRLKEIQKRPNYANRLLAMGLVRDYYYNNLAKSRTVRSVDNDLHTGMIYQDVLPVLSSMCGVDDDGYGKLNYIKPDFICTIAGATQDNTISLIKVNTRMSKLETAIRHLKRKINKLERKLSYEQALIQ
jgi:hypothetical protein|nr:MAG TPA: Receptor recognition protein, Long tail, Helical sandwich, Tail fiber [Caudoviricetes sp.]